MMWGGIAMNLGVHGSKARMKHRPPRQKLIDEQVDMCSDFVEAAARGLMPGPSEAVTRGENCDARWLRPSALLAPVRWFYHQGDWLTKRKIRMFTVG